MKLSALASVSLALLAASSAPPRAEGPVFRPREGEELATSWERRVALELGEGFEYSIVVDGIELEWWPFPIYLELVDEAHFGLVDRYLDFEDGAPRALMREHERLDRRMVHRLREHVADSGDGECALEGLRVRFERDGAEGAFAAVSVEPDYRRAREELDGLRAQADLAGFLPPGAAEEGDVWEVPAAAVVAALEPAGTLAFEHEGDTSPFDPLEGRLLAELTGALDAEWRATEQVRGREVARIALDGELRIESDRERSGRVLRAGDDEPVDGFERLARTVVASVAGELEWDLAAGRARALRLDAALSVDVLLEGRSSDGGTTTRLRGTWTGRLALRARCDGR